MSRLSRRLSVAWSAVRCPRCNQLVNPETVAPPPAAPGADVDPRWSFIWTPPTGDFCPECEFPLSKYFRRLKWIRLLVVGTAIVVVAFAAQLIGVANYLSPRYMDATKVGVLIGGVMALAGVAGIVIGGRRSPAGTPQ